MATRERIGGEPFLTALKTAGAGIGQAGAIDEPFVLFGRGHRVRIFPGGILPSWPNPGGFVRGRHQPVCLGSAPWDNRNSVFGVCRPWFSVFIGIASIRFRYPGVALGANLVGIPSSVRGRSHANQWAFRGIVRVPFPIQANDLSKRSFGVVMGRSRMDKNGFSGLTI